MLDVSEFHFSETKAAVDSDRTQGNICSDIQQTSEADFQNTLHSAVIQVCYAILIPLNRIIVHNMFDLKNDVSAKVLLTSQ